MSEELTNIWFGGLYQFYIQFCDLTGMYIDHDGDSPLWTIAVGVGVAFLAFWLVRMSIRLIKSFAKSAK